MALAADDEWYHVEIYSGIPKAADIRREAVVERELKRKRGELTSTQSRNRVRCICTRDE